MIKKVLATVIAAGALSVPLAGAAWADPSADNPGTPGNFGGPPGQGVNQVAKLPGSVAGDVRAGTGGTFQSPGDVIKNSAPGHQP
jgi:hypothetical protein